MAPSHYLKITNLRLQTHFPGTNELNIYRLSDSRCIIACTRYINFQMLKDMHLFSVPHGNQDLAGASTPDAPTPQGSRDTRSSETDDVTTGTPGDQDARDSTTRVPKPVSPRNKQLKKTISYLRTRISCLKRTKVPATPRTTTSVIRNVCQELDGLLPEETAKFVKSRIIANQRKSKAGNRWTLSDKMFALSIFYHSRKAYRILHKLFVLPSKTTLNTLRPTQYGRHFADDIFKCIFLNENVWIPIKISLKFVHKGPINNIPALVQIMAWRRQGDKPLSGPMMVRLPMHICVTRPQWVKSC